MNRVISIFLLISITLTSMNNISEKKNDIPLNSNEIKALDIVNWLELASDIVSEGEGYRIKERYMMNTNTWGEETGGILYRPDCNIETAYAFLKAWQRTGNTKYLQLARGIYKYTITLQNADGSFSFFVDSKGITSDAYFTNDNSEVAIFLFRMSEIDTENALEYKYTAIKVVEWLLQIQNADGSYRNRNGYYNESVMFTAHAVSALSMAYSINAKDEYKIAIENALIYIKNNTNANGRVMTAYETAGIEEWRPPSSDQALAIRAYAMAEKYVKNSTYIDEWRMERQKLLGWFDQLIDSSGAVKNGLGENITNADSTRITDHVYTTPFAIEAYKLSYELDDNQKYLDSALIIVDFAVNNIYYSKQVQTNGILRGAYDLVDKDWNTEEVVQNESEEGGGNAIYTGWSNAPMVSLIFEIEHYRE